MNPKEKGNEGQITVPEQYIVIQIQVQTGIDRYRQAQAGTERYSPSHGHLSAFLTDPHRM